MSESDIVRLRALVQRMEESLAKARREIKRLEERNLVRVVFPGDREVFTYALPRTDPPVKIGDYLTVWSPRTNRVEIVQIKQHGRGSWPGPYKPAYRVKSIIDETGGITSFPGGAWSNVPDLDPEGDDSFRGSDI